MATKRLYNPEDWVTIKYGEYAGHYGKIAMQGIDGNYVVLPYDENDEPQSMTSLNEDAFEKIEPLSLTRKEFKALLRGETLYSEIKENVFPAFNVRPKTKYAFSAEDISCALKNFNEREDCLTIFKEWFWLIINIFYKDLKIEERYNEELFSDAPESDDEIFSVAYGLCEKLYWRLEERLSQKEDIEKLIIKFDNPVDWGDGFFENHQLEETAYREVCSDIISRVETYLENQKLPRAEWKYSITSKRHIINSYEDESDLDGASDETVAVYRQFVEDLSQNGDPAALKVLGWGYYEGNKIYAQNWFLAEKYLRRLYNKTGDPFAANSLGYIYYYGRTNCGIPQYEKAFSYFSIGALAGVDESIYKAADMLIAGRGVVRNIDVGLNMLVEGYKNSMEEFCDGHFDNKLADYALRMGNACRDNLIYGMGIRDAYKFYLEAQFAIKRRRENSNYYGDDHVEAKIEHELAMIRENVGIDSNCNTLRMDFPIFINLIYDDKYPVKVSIKIKKGSNNGTLTLSRFNLADGMLDDKLIPPEMDSLKIFEPSKMLVAYPELSYAELVSEITYKMENISVAQAPENGPYFLSDGFRKNDKTNSLELYFGGEMVAAIDAQWFVIEVKK